MAFSAGMYFSNGSGNIVFAEHINSMLNAQRGNYVVDTATNGGAVTANGTSNLTTTTADIDIADVDVFNNGSETNLSSITSIDLSEAYDDLSAGQSLYVLIYIKSNGTISNPTDAGGNEGVGTAASTGQQLPPAIPENAVPLALITLTNGDTSVDSSDIEDYRIEGPQGGYFNGDVIQPDSQYIVQGSDDDVRYGFDGANWIFQESTTTKFSYIVGSDYLRFQDSVSASFGTGDDYLLYFDGTDYYIQDTTTAGDLKFLLKNSFLILDEDDTGNPVIFDFDTTNRTITSGASGDDMAWTHYGGFTLSSGDLDLNGNDLNQAPSTIFNNTLTIHQGFYDDTFNGWLAGQFLKGDGSVNNIHYTIGMGIEPDATDDAKTFTAHNPNDNLEQAWLTFNNGVAYLGATAVTDGGTITFTSDYGLKLDTTTATLGVDLDLNGNNLDHVASIDNAGSAIVFNDDLDLTENNIDNVTRIGTSASGNSIDLGSSASSSLIFTTSSTDRWLITATGGHFVPNTTDTFDIGSSSIRVSTIYLVNNPDVSSSIRYKEVVDNLNNTLSVMSTAKAIKYKHKNSDEDRIRLGLIAEEIAEIYPESVGFDKEGNPDAIRYGDLVPVLWQGILDLKERVEELENTF